MRDKVRQLVEKKAKLDQYRPLEVSLANNLIDWLRVELTYTSNAIEGNTLSRAETAMVVEKGLTVEGKTLTEHQEAINHGLAFDWVVNESKQADAKITETMILDLHRLILQKNDDNNAGRYRNVSVRIAGSTVIMPNPVKVPQLMTEFVDWLNNNTEDQLNLAADAHFKLVSIHPFVDGNGRTARLLMNLILMKAGYPPAIIRREDRLKYITSIEKAQLGGSSDDFYEIIYTAVDKSLDIYLTALEEKNEAENLDVKKLLKIGDLAKLSGETVPTIRHWTQEGLLKVSSYSPGGYQLYEPSSVNIVAKVRDLQQKRRLTIGEIKKELD